MTDIDGRGISGLEKYFDGTLSTGAPIKVALDIRIQEMLHRELSAAMQEFRAIGAAGLVLDANSGEVVSLVSLPDFDANIPGSAGGETAFNRATKGVYEMGSTFKLFTAAMALDSGTVDFNGGYDASEPIKVSRFTIRDFHGKNRWLSVPEIIMYSSNIGAAKMALDVGSKAQRSYLGQFGLLTPASVELPEVGRPLMPARWREINTMTISYGHGIAVSPLQMASGVASLVNGGLYVPPTMLKRDAGEAIESKRVISQQTSEQVRNLMRLVVSKGTGSKAAVKGYGVGGKTGTADKLSVRGYRKNATISSFVGAFPMTAPRYILLVMVDEPKGNARTANYSTGGWVAAPAVGHVVQRMAPLLGMAPDRRVAEKDDVPSLEKPDRGVLKKRAAPRKKTLIKAKAGEVVPKISGGGEQHMLRRVRAVLGAVNANSGAEKAGATSAIGSPEHALATY
ncbi:MAG: penicillin-binding protein 2, partial [Alphaproteobacteria bacterium]|nr:penicillin-binding protein 2 [Alphaproteobacteria bacterium]